VAAFGFGQWLHFGFARWTHFDISAPLNVRDKLMIAVPLITQTTWLILDSKSSQSLEKSC
jgi:hypothetical protein